MNFGVCSLVENVLMAILGNKTAFSMLEGRNTTTGFEVLLTVCSSQTTGIPLFLPVQACFALYRIDIISIQVSSEILTTICGFRVIFRARWQKV